MKRILVIFFLLVNVNLFAQSELEFFVDIRFREVQKPVVLFEIIKPRLDEDATDNGYKIEKIDIIKYDDPEKQNLLSVSLRVISNEDEEDGGWDFCSDIRKVIAGELLEQKIAFTRIDCRF